MSRGGTIQRDSCQELAFRVEVTGLHGTSRRRDSSVPERSRLRTSESGASAGGSRPSLFDGLSSGFSPFGAVRNLGASEGASGTSTGGVSSGDNAQILTGMANAAIVSQLQERARASLVGSAVGAEVFHIGSPSDQQGKESFNSTESSNASKYFTSFFWTYRFTFYFWKCTTWRSYELIWDDV